MYVPKPFEVTDQKTIYSFIRANAFGEMVSTVDNRPFATHVPFLLEENESTLTTHLAKQNQQLKNIDGQEVLIIFSGPHGYISPGWYSSPGVPTWNYQAVHIYGKAVTFDEPARLRELIETLTDKYEARFEQPWRPTYNEKLLQAIIGVEIQISEVQCKYKLSQNKPQSDRAGIIAHLERSDSKALADAMKDFGK